METQDLSKNIYLYVIGATQGLQNIGVTKHVDVKLADLQAASDLPLIIHLKTLAPRPRRTLWRVQHAMRSKRQAGNWYDLSPDAARHALQERL